MCAIDRFVNCSPLVLFSGVSKRVSRGAIVGEEMPFSPTRLRLAIRADL